VAAPGGGAADGRPSPPKVQVSAILQILALALILAVNNFFGALSLGAAPLSLRHRVGVVALFAASDCGLPLLGVVLGAGLARALGPAAADVGVVLIMLTGIYLVVDVLRRGAAAGGAHAARHGRPRPADGGGPGGSESRRPAVPAPPPGPLPARTAAGRPAAAAPTQVAVAPLLLTSVALGLDNLGAAVGLGATGVDVPLALVTFAVVTGLVTAAGLALGGLVRRHLPRRAASGLAGALLFGTGATMLTARLLHG
jgi:putative Mn2+ efflux pump MntP